MAELGADARLARALVAASSTAALATLDGDGWPFASYVAVAAASSGEPLLLLSTLAAHTCNLGRDSRASLLFVREAAESSEDLAAERLTLTGAARPDGDIASRESYLARHPAARRYADFGDFSFDRFEIRAAHLVAGFGRIAAIPPADLLAGEDAGPATGLTNVR